VEGGVSLSEAIVDSAGQPATIRVGVVTSTSPFEVTVQGSAFKVLGRIGAAPALGATVLLLGQSVKGSKSSASSWVVLGQIVPA
jgi:hypothetical protein